MTDPIDPKYCGLGSRNTGADDPYWKIACAPHDEDYDKILLAIQLKNKIKDLEEQKKLAEELYKQSIKPLPTFIKFIKNITKVVVQNPSWYTVGAYPFFAVIGGFGGILRQQQLLFRLKGREKNLYEGD